MKYMHDIQIIIKSLLALLSTMFEVYGIGNTHTHSKNVNMNYNTGQYLQEKSEK